MIGVVCAIAILSAGCKSKESEAPTPSSTQDVPAETAETEYQPEPVETHEGEVRSFYTGEWMDEKKAKNRPVAVMTENTHVTLPQYGIGNADIIYECPVEGGITRLMTIYQDYASLKKVGNVRSCRLYYVYFAKEFEAVYFHAGESKYALDVLNSSFIDNVDGITGKGGAFYYRDNSRRAPHNLYTTGENLASAMKTYGYDTKLPENYTSHYRFTTEDSQNLLYYRYEFGDKQIDGSTGEQLAVKNIILQNCYSSLKDSKNGTLDIDYLSGGSGMYITNGKAVPITWKRSSANDITHYYTQDGQEIILNPGKTWVEIVENSRASQNKISAE